MKIRTKADFTRLSQAGLLGNYLRAWDTRDALEASRYRGWVTIRAKDKQSPHFVPWAHTLGKHQDYPSVDCALLLMKINGADLDRVYFQEVPGPAAYRPIQFEAMLGPTWQGAGVGVELFYELDTTNPLRDIRERCRTATGLVSQALLRTRLDPAGYDTLTDIWDRHPTATIEATQFSEPVGALRQRLIIWEVRDF